MQKSDLTISCLGAALRLALPMVVGKKVTKYFELVKPMIEFKYELIRSRGNNIFELATLEEIDKLTSASAGGGSASSKTGEFSDDINLDDVNKRFL